MALAFGRLVQLSVNLRQEEMALGNGRGQAGSKEQLGFGLLKLVQLDITPAEEEVGLREGRLFGFRSLQVITSLVEMLFEQRNVAQIEISARIVRRFSKGQEKLLLRRFELSEDKVLYSQREMDAHGIRRLRERGLVFLNGSLVVTLVRIKIAQKSVKLEGIRIKLPEPVKRPERSFHV